MEKRKSKNFWRKLVIFSEVLLVKSLELPAKRGETDIKKRGVIEKKGTSGKYFIYGEKFFFF